MKHIYTVENFNKEKYNNIINVETTINKSIISDYSVFFDKHIICFKYIERIEFDRDKENLKIYYFYQKDDEIFYSILNAKLKDFDEFVGAWIGFICNMFYIVLRNKEIEYT